MAFRGITTAVRTALLHGRAAGCATQKDFDGAIRYSQEALDLDGTEVFGLSSLAQYLEHAGRDEEALEVAERALRISSNEYYALQVGARLYAKLGDYQRARDYVLRSLASEPRSSNRWDRWERWMSKGLHSLGGLAVSLARRLPGLRNRVYQGALDKHRKHADPFDEWDESLRHWRRWAEDYLKWYSENVEESQGGAVH
jgi:tetratricopeptide (TPR) repeat protein